jgi:hypothetical protein
MNRGANGTSPSGLEVREGGQFRMQPYGTLTFKVDGEVTSNQVKTITNENTNSNRLQFGNIYIESGANNIVTTKSSFDIVGSALGTATTGPNAASFINAGGEFLATEGTVSFIGDRNFVEAASFTNIASTTGRTQFANLRTTGQIQLRLNDGDEIFVTENLRADSMST